jgi:DNA-binding LytR/AlgR family response regulator
MARLLAVTSEDHYLRLHMEGGDKPLLLYRFGDALADLSTLDGLQVHRGAWIAARAVSAAAREGRRWWLRLPDGTRLPVSERHMPAVRARGWLAR